MGGTDKLDPSCLQFAQIKKTSGNRLAKAMRKEGRKHSIKELEVLCSTERGAGPKPPKTEDGKRPEKGQTDFGHHELHTADHGPDDCQQGHLSACRIRAHALHRRGRSAMLGPEQSSLQAAKYYDMHFYIDFLQEDPAGFLDASDTLGLAFLSCTAAPNSELERPAECDSEPWCASLVGGRQQNGHRRP